jgi:hypothetical protein
VFSPRKTQGGPKAAPPADGRTPARTP